MTKRLMMADFEWENAELEDDTEDRDDVKESDADIDDDMDDELKDTEGTTY